MANPTIIRLKDLAERNLLEYAKYVNKTRSVVGVDGVKTVQRRLLYVLYKLARNKFVKAATVVGETFKYHPHGNSYDALVQLVQMGWAIGQGNWGSRLGLEPISPAAERYTEVRFNPVFEQFFRLIDYVPWVVGDIGFKEPLYLPTPIPICIIKFTRYPIYAQGIGVGLRSVFPVYDINDLFNRLKHLVAKKDINENVIKPDFGEYIVEKADVKSILHTGVGKIYLKPKLLVNETKREVEILSAPGNVLKAVDKYLDYVNVVDLSTPLQTRIIVKIKPRRQLKIDELVKHLQKHLSQTIHVSCYVAIPDDNGEYATYQIGVDSWLLQTFVRFTKALYTKLSVEKNQIQQKLQEYQLIEKLKPYIQQALAKTNGKLDVDKFCLEVSPKVNVSPDEIKSLLDKYSIRKLLTYKLDEEKLKSQIQSIDNKLQNILQYSIDETGEMVEKIASGVK